MRRHHLFISHSWTYNDQYYRIVNLLRRRPYFDFSDYSVPRYDPIHNAENDAQLREAIKRKMQSCGVVLVLAGVYSTHSKWINIEIDLAKHGFSYPKPIIAIRPRGNTRISVRVRNAATTIVNWNTESIVDAIRSV